MRTGILIAVLPLLAAMPAWADAASDACSPAGLKPVFDTQKVGLYPADALKRDQEGIARLRVVVDKNGVASEVTLAKSSGVPALDAAAIAAVKGHWHWEKPPAECQAGIALQVPIVWRTSRLWPVAIYSDDPRYPSAARDAGEEGKGSVKIALSADGNVTDTKVGLSTGFADLDAAMQRLALGLRFHPAVDAHGIGVPVTISMSYDWIMKPPDTDEAAK
jgi:TonB family protein